MLKMFALPCTVFLKCKICSSDERKHAEKLEMNVLKLSLYWVKVLSEDTLACLGRLFK